MKDVNNSKLLNVLIPCGIALFLFCAVVAFVSSTPKMIDILNILFMILQFIFGLLIVIFSVRWTHRATQLFIGLIFIFWDILYVLFNYVFTVSIKQVWPIYAVFVGILLFVSGFYKYRTPKFGYVIPSATLIGMGVWYSFFSFKIIKKPFLTVASNLGTIFMLLIAALLIILFLVQQRHKKFVLSDDETGTFSDEDEEIGKIEE